MHVRIDERRREQESLALDDSMRVRVEIRAESRDHAVVDANVHGSVDRLDRIDHACAPDDDVLLRPRLGEQHHATSMTDSVLISTGPVVRRS